MVVLSYSLPFWVPVVFLAYAIGRKKFGLWLLFILLTIEAVSIVYAKYSFEWITWYYGF